MTAAVRIDPDDAQRRAASPASSVWVSASAGSAARAGSRRRPSQTVGAETAPIRASSGTTPNAVWSSWRPRSRSSTWRHSPRDCASPSCACRSVWTVITLKYAASNDAAYANPTNASTTRSPGPRASARSLPERRWRTATQTATSSAAGSTETRVPTASTMAARAALRQAAIEDALSSISLGADSPRRLENSSAFPTRVRNPMIFESLKNDDLLFKLR